MESEGLKVSKRVRGFEVEALQINLRLLRCSARKTEQRDLRREEGKVSNRNPKAGEASQRLEVRNAPLEAYRS